MNRFFIRLIGGTLAGMTGFLNTAKALECTISQEKSASFAYYKSQKCPSSILYTADSRQTNFPGNNPNLSTNEYAYLMAATKEIKVSENGECVSREVGISAGVFLMPCTQNKTSFHEKVKTCSYAYESPESGLYACTIDNMGTVTAPSDDFFKAYDGCLCPAGQTCSNDSGGSGSGESSGTSCKFYYYEGIRAAKESFIFVGCKPGYYQNREVGSGEVFTSTSAVDELCSLCSGMQYNNGTVSTFKPSAGITGQSGIWWKSNGGIGINSCYANGEIQDEAGVFTFSSNCTYGG